MRDYISAFQHSLKTTDYFLQIEIGNEILSYYKLNQDLQVQLDYLRSISAAKSARIQMQSDEKVKDLELQNILAQSQLDHEKANLFKPEKKYTVLNTHFDTDPTFYEFGSHFGLQSTILVD